MKKLGTESCVPSQGAGTAYGASNENKDPVLHVAKMVATRSLGVVVASAARMPFARRKGHPIPGRSFSF